jgi:catechol 2,3-dioxygenase-like lactoylglutathione lyase family enzyme
MTTTAGTRRGSGPIHHVSIAVSSLERSVHFYRDLLGLRPTMRTDVGGQQIESIVRVPSTARGRIQVLDGGVALGQIELVEWSGAGDEIASADRSVTRPGSMILSFEIAEEQLVILHARLSDAGYRCWSLPGRIELPGYGHAVAFIVEDPDANPIELMTLVRESKPATAASSEARK